jgi:hypothetical protein
MRGLSNYLFLSLALRAQQLDYILDETAEV